MGDIDYKVLVKYVNSKENENLLYHTLYLLNNLSENPKFIQQILKIKEVKSLIIKGLALDNAQAYSRALNLFIQIFKYQKSKMNSSARDSKADYTIEDNIVT